MNKFHIVKMVISNGFQDFQFEIWMKSPFAWSGKWERPVLLHNNSYTCHVAHKIVNKKFHVVQTAILNGLEDF